MENSGIISEGSSTAVIDTVTGTSNFLVSAFQSFNGFGDVFAFIVPLGLLTWSATKSLSYYGDNSTKDTELEEAYDSELYNKAIVPLYKILNSHLASSEVFDVELSFGEYEEEKHRLLSEYDYSNVVGVLGFTDAIEIIEEVRKERKKIKTTRQFNRNLLVFMTLVSALSIISLGVYYFSPFKTTGLICYFVTLVLALLSLVIFYFKSISIDSLQNEKR